MSDEEECSEAPPTVSAEQIEAAAIFGFESPDYNDMKWSRLPEWSRRSKVEYMQRLFRAAGFRVEEVWCDG